MQQETDKKASAELTQQLHREFKDVFIGIRCFNGTLSLKIKPESKPIQVPWGMYPMNYKKTLNEE